MESVTLIFVLSGCYSQAGLTALMLATKEGHASVVKTLLVGRADPNITDKVYCCLLHVWMMYILLLIVCAQTSGWTAIFFAVEQGNLEITELLIKGGAKLDIKDNVR